MFLHFDLSKHYDPHENISFMHLFGRWLYMTIWPAISSSSIFEKNSYISTEGLIKRKCHLNEHRFRHNFTDCINPLCSCSLEMENTLHFFLHCQHYLTFRMGLMNKVNQIDENFSCLSDNNKVNLPLFVTQDLMTMKTISSYQPQLHAF